MEALLSSLEICTNSLGSISKELVKAKPLPPTLILQLENASSDNKNQWIFGVSSILFIELFFERFTSIFSLLDTLMRTLMLYSVAR